MAGESEARKSRRARERWARRQEQCVPQLTLLSQMQYLSCITSLDVRANFSIVTVCTVERSNLRLSLRSLNFVSQSSHLEARSNAYDMNK